MCPPPTVLPVFLECLSGYDILIDQAVHIEGPQTIINAFAADFNGTIFDVFLSTEQMSIYDTSIAPLGNNQEQFSGTGIAFLGVNTNVDFYNIAMQIPLSTSFVPGPALPDNTTYYGLVISGMVSNPIRSGRNLTVNLTLDVRILGISTLNGYTKVTNYSCNAPPPASFPTQCQEILEALYVAQGQIGNTRFVFPLRYDSGAGTPTYTITDVQFLDTVPTVIEHLQNDSGSTLFYLAYPVSFTVNGANGVSVPQVSYILNLDIISVVIPENAIYLLDFRIQDVGFYNISATQADVYPLQGTGIISIINNSTTTELTTTTDQCAQPVINDFDDILPPRPDLATRNAPLAKMLRAQ